MRPMPEHPWPRPCTLKTAFRHFLGVLLCAAASTIAAHDLHLSVQAEVDGLRGQVFYAGGVPARHETVTLLDSETAESLARVSTDEEGRFHLRLVASGTYRVVVDDGKGHRAEAMVVWSPPLPTAKTVDVATLAAALRTEIAPLREDLARLSERTRLADLIGGVGILLGLAGAFAWWRARIRR